jgi:hypothetical protein
MNPKSSADVFVYLWAVTGLPWALAMAAILQESIQYWIVAGALFGLVMAAFGTPKLKGETVSVGYADEKEQFVGRVNVACAEIGYEPGSRTGDYLSYKATGDSSFSIGPIKIAPASYLGVGVQVGAGTATIVGPHDTVLKVQQRLSA